MFANSGIQPSGVSAYASAASGTTTVGPLWPFASGYSMWAGSCPGSDPALLGGRPAAVTPTKGSTTVATIPLQGVAITTTLNNQAANVPVTATSLPAGGCLSTDGTIQLGTSAAGVLNVALPYGNWTLSATINGKVVQDTITLTPTAGDTSILAGT